MGGGRAPRVAVRWHGSVFDSSDEGDEARQFIFGLDDLGIPVSVVPFPSYDARWTLPRAEVARLQVLGQTPTPSGPIVSVFHTMLPSSWRIEGADYHVGRAMFETDRVPEDWPPAGGALDEIWVPSAFNMETFARAGVPRTKLRRVPGAIDVERFARPARRLTIPGARRFNFLSVFGWGLRKGWDVLLLAFLEEFTRGEDVALGRATASVGTSRPSCVVTGSAGSGRGRSSCVPSCSGESSFRRSTRRPTPSCCRREARGVAGRSWRRC